MPKILFTTILALLVNILHGQATDQTEYTVNSVSFKMISVDGAFLIGETEVTQELWQAVMGKKPSCFEGLHNPVENVSWDDCQVFISKLNALTGKNFRLPTEAEWEYAASGGNKSKGYKYSGSNDIGKIAWYDGNSKEETHAVKTKSPNELGIYDMSGNVWEWCQDQYDDTSDRTFRGGSFYDLATYCHIADRNGDEPSFKSQILGLRLAL